MLILFSAVPCSSPSFTSCIHSSRFLDWICTVSSKFFDTQVLSVSTKELVLPCQARCVLSRLRFTGHSLLLNSYLSKLDRIENRSCSTCGHPIQDTSHLILLDPAKDSLSDSLFFYDLWSKPSEVARLLETMAFRHAPMPRKRSGNNNNTWYFGAFNCGGFSTSKRFCSKLSNLSFMLYSSRYING